MNQTSEQIVRQVISSLTIPPIALTLTQEEADAIKEYVRVVYFEDNIQGPVHSGLVRNAGPLEITDEEAAKLYRCNIGTEFATAGRYEWRSGERLIDCKVAEEMDIIALIDKRQADYSAWLWANLELAAQGEKLLPRLEWDKPGRKIFTYADMVSGILK